MEACPIFSVPTASRFNSVVSVSPRVWEGVTAGFDSSERSFAEQDMAHPRSPGSTRAQVFLCNSR